MTKIAVKTFAVTGAGGYLGEHLSRYLRSRGYYVIELHRYNLGQPIFHTDEKVPFCLEQGQIGRRWDGIDVLVHCAFDFSCREKGEYEETNLKGTLKLFQYASKHGVKKIVHISSMSAFEGCRSLYGRTKLKIEKAGFAFNVVSMRPGLIYGGKNLGMFGKLQRIVELLPIVPFIQSRGRLSLIHIDDLCQTILEAAIEDLRMPEEISVAHPKSFSMKKILQQIAKMSGKRRLLVPVNWLLIYVALILFDRILPGKLPLTKDNLLGFVYANRYPRFFPDAEMRYLEFDHQ